jgi:hypothetical protein
VTPIRIMTRVALSKRRLTNTGADAAIPANSGAVSATNSAKSAAVTPTIYMTTNNEFTIGRINFGPRDSFTTLGQLIDEIGAQEELVDDLCLLAGDLLTEIHEITSGIYEL